MPKQVSYTKGGGGGFFKPNAGGYPAIIVGVIELGTEGKDYKKDGNIKDVEELRVVYEIEAEQEKYDSEKQELTGVMEMKVGTVGQNYTTIISDNSKLGKVIKAVYGVDSMDEIKNFSLDKLLGIKCYIDVDLVGKEKNFPVVKSVTALNKKFESALHKQGTKNFYFGMEDADDFIDGFEQDLKQHLPSWEIDRIKASQEYKALMKELGVEVPETLQEQEVNMQKEAEERKKEQAKVDAEPTVSEKDAKGVFSGEEIPTEEPKTTEEARKESKVKDKSFE